VSGPLSSLVITRSIESRRSLSSVVLECTHALCNSYRIAVGEYACMRPKICDGVLIVYR